MLQLMWLEVGLCEWVWEGLQLLSDCVVRKDGCLSRGKMWIGVAQHTWWTCEVCAHFGYPTWLISAGWLSLHSPSVSDGRKSCTSQCRICARLRRFPYINYVGINLCFQNKLPQSSPCFLFVLPFVWLASYAPVQFANRNCVAKRAFFSSYLKIRR